MLSMVWIQSVIGREDLPSKMESNTNSEALYMAKTMLGITNPGLDSKRSPQPHRTTWLASRMFEDRRPSYRYSLSGSTIGRD